MVSLAFDAQQLSPSSEYRLLFFIVIINRRYIGIGRIARENIYRETLKRIYIYNK